MVKLSEEEIDTLLSKFNYKNLGERYRVLEELFDIQEGSIVIDGGAFHGDMMQYFSKKVGDTGKVYSFEPMPENISMLQTIISVQPIDNIELVPFGLWNKNEKLKFFFSSYPNAGSILEDFRKVTESFTIIRGMALDEYAKKKDIQKIDYIWTNIEGAEVNFLKGAKETLLNNDCKLCISTHMVNDDYTTTDDVIKILTEYGYKCERVKNHEMWIYAYKE